MTQVPSNGMVSTTKAGWIVYWVTFGLMAASAICFMGITLLKPQKHRKHGYCTALIVSVAGFAYYAMASQGGSTYIHQIHGDNQRQIYWARYVDWVFTTPLLILDLLLMAACPVGTAMWIIGADIFMIVLGLAGGVNTHKFKWGYFAMSCFCEVAINIGLLFVAMRSAVARGGGVAKVYAGLAAYLSILWWGYPIVWGLAEGSNLISSDAEIAAYAGLDIAAKVFFGWMVMATYPIISQQQEREAKEGKGFPSLLEASIDTPLSITQNLNSTPSPMATRNLPTVDPVGTDGATTMV
ncbi:hypothetical protein ABBQ38_009844 [Trebouxia sp. C0009 RCD-2024]